MYMIYSDHNQVHIFIELGLLSNSHIELAQIITGAHILLALILTGSCFISSDYNPVHILCSYLDGIIFWSYSDLKPGYIFNVLQSQSSSLIYHVQIIIQFTYWSCLYLDGIIFLSSSYLNPLHIFNVLRLQSSSHIYGAQILTRNTYWSTLNYCLVHKLKLLVS